MIFKDEADKAAAVQHLPTLKDHPAWKYLERALDGNAAHLTDQLKTRDDFRSLEEVQYLQRRLADIESFRALPETLLTAAQDRPVEPEDQEVYDLPEPTTQP